MKINTNSIDRLIDKINQIEGVILYKRDTFDLETKRLFKQSKEKLNYKRITENLRYIREILTAITDYLKEYEHEHFALFERYIFTILYDALIIKTSRFLK